MSLSVWQNDMPPEILCQVFAFWLDTSRYHDSLDLTLPLNVSRHIWVLGRVCSLWRNVSRSSVLENSWKIRIQAVQTTTVTSEDQQPKLSFDSASLRQFQCAAELLPAGRNISFDVMPPANIHSNIPLPVSPNSILEFLPLVYSMSWSVVFDPSFLPPKSLEGLKSLSIYHRNPKETTGSFSLEQFGDSPNLQALFMKIQAPQLFFSGIPLSCLKDLVLDTMDRHVARSRINEIVLAWRNLFESRAITSLSCLQELTVKLQSDLLGFFLTADFPWHQLTKLHLHIWGAVSNEDLALLPCPLRLSTNLVRLEINLNDAGQPMVNHQEELPITFPFLQHLSISGPISLSMFGSLVSLENLRSFEARFAISLSEFYFIVQQCPVLTDLIALITPSTHPSASSGLIILSYLHTLQISFNEEVKKWSPASFPTLLVLPRLTSLTVHVSDYGMFPFDFSLDLINRSNCQLSKASFLLHDPSSLAPQPVETVLPLLTVINNARTVHTKGFIFPRVVLAAIAAGNLLPCLFDLALTASTFDQFLSTINLRLRREKTCGSIKLQKIRGYISGYPQNDAEDSAEEERLKTLLQAASEKVTRKYRNTICYLEYIYPSNFDDFSSFNDIESLLGFYTAFDQRRYY